MKIIFSHLLSNTGTGSSVVVSVLLSPFFFFFEDGVIPGSLSPSRSSSSSQLKS